MAYGETDVLIATGTMEVINAFVMYLSCNKSPCINITSYKLLPCRRYVKLPVVTIIRYTQSNKIWKPYNLKIIGSKKTTGYKQER